MRGLLAGSLEEISVQALYKSALDKIYVRDLLARFLQQISMPLCNVSAQDLHKRCPGKISVQDLWQDLLVRSL